MILLMYVKLRTAQCSLFYVLCYFCVRGQFLMWHAASTTSKQLQRPVKSYFCHVQVGGHVKVYLNIEDLFCLP